MHVLYDAAATAQTDWAFPAALSAMAVFVAWIGSVHRRWVYVVVLAFAALPVGVWVRALASARDTSCQVIEGPVESASWSHFVLQGRTLDLPFTLPRPRGTHYPPAVVLIGRQVRACVRGVDVVRLEAEDLASLQVSARTPAERAVPAAIPLFLLTIFGVLSLLLGWRSLARRYPGRPLDGKSYWWQSISINSRGGANNCVRICLGEEGLRLNVMPPFGFGCVPITVGWQDVARIDVDKFLWSRRARLLLTNRSILTVYGASVTDMQSRLDAWRAARITK
jgi:hypothetical protein